MSAVTPHLADAKHVRPKQSAASRRIRVNRLLDELAPIALVQYDLTLQFRVATDSGDPACGSALLGTLDRHFTHPEGIDILLAP